GEPIYLRPATVPPIPGSDAAAKADPAIESERCWSTPELVTDPIHETFGPCALDVASPAQPVHVQALKWFTKEDDGLKQSWRIPESGYLFMNPPWNPEVRGERRPIRWWIDKARLEMSLGNVRRAIVVLPSKRSDAFDSLKADGAA